MTQAEAAAARRAYLKTQGQAEDVRSHGRMVDLLLAPRRHEGSASVLR